MTADANPVQLFTFEDMRLKVGDRLQIEPPCNVASDRLIVRLIGYLEGRGLMVTPPINPAGVRPFLEGDPVTIRHFSGQGAFGFKSFVERLVKVPFEYLHLTYPQKVEALIIRKSPRVRTQVRAEIGTAGQDPPVEGLIINLSPRGALLRVPTTLGEPGTEIRLKFPLSHSGPSTDMALEGLLRTVTALPEDDTGLQHQYGIEFANVTEQNTIALEAYVYRALVENPHNLV